MEEPEGGASGKEPICQCRRHKRHIRDMGSVPWLGRSPGREHGSPLQYSCLEDPTGRRTWWATVHAWHGVGHDTHTRMHTEGHLDCFQVLVDIFLIVFKVGMKFTRKGYYPWVDCCVIVIYIEILVMNHQYSPRLPR